MFSKYKARQNHCGDFSVKIFYLPNLLALILAILPWVTHAGTDLAFEPWIEGYLDIHHINTGRGDAAFFIFPDGTTMLFDCGDLDTRYIDRLEPLKIAAAKPNDSQSPGKWVAQYIRKFLPQNKPASLNYAVISHFHSDHYGAVTESSTKSKSGEYYLTGITEVGDSISIETLIDRQDPSNVEPNEIQKSYKDTPTYQNYLSFVHHHQTKGKLKREPLMVGSKEQISLQFNANAYPAFSVRNIKANNIIWTGKGSESVEYFKLPEMLTDKLRFSENPLSLAIKINYGKFDYFTGGDMTGSRELGEPYWFDVETPVGKAVQEVDVLVLNHHGNRDATNANFLKALTPRVLVQQSWISDHLGSEVLHRMLSKNFYPEPRDIFATNILEETKVAIGPWLTNTYKSMQGHIVIRVLPSGNEYFVYILDDSVKRTFPITVHGPYTSR